jgi:hypothetical protein
MTVKIEGIVYDWDILSAAATQVLVNLQPSGQFTGMIASSELQLQALIAAAISSRARTEVTYKAGPPNQVVSLHITPKNAVGPDPSRYMVAELGNAGIAGTIDVALCSSVQTLKAYTKRPEILTLLATALGKGLPVENVRLQADELVGCKINVP